jgi:hypothetical protein
VRFKPSVDGDLLHLPRKKDGGISDTNGRWSFDSTSELFTKLKVAGTADGNCADGWTVVSGN